MCSQGLAQHLRSSNKVAFPNFEEACKIQLPTCEWALGEPRHQQPCAPGVISPCSMPLWHIISYNSDITMPCHCHVQAAPQAPQAPGEGSGEPAPPPSSPGSLIPRPKAALPDDLGQGRSAPYSIHSRISFVPVGNCPWEELKQRWLCSRSLAQTIPVSVFRGRETYYISCPSEDNVEEWRGYSLLGL